MRFKDATTLKYAFEGQPHRLRFTSSRPSEFAGGGLALVGIELQSETGRAGTLVMRRALPDDDLTDFGPLDKAEPTVLFKGVESVEFSYFGADNDLSDPRWMNEWTLPARIPLLVRMRLKDAEGVPHAEFVARVMLGEEAGCLENTFQRSCRPRRP